MNPAHHGAVAERDWNRDEVKPFPVGHRLQESAIDVDDAWLHLYTTLFANRRVTARGLVGGEDSPG